MSTPTCSNVSASRTRKRDLVPAPTTDMTTKAGPTRSQLITYAMAAAVAGGMGVMAVNLGLGSLARPGSGFWPLIVSIGIALGAALSLLETFRQTAGGEDSGPRRRNLSLAIGLLAAYVVLFSMIGWIVATVVVAPIWMVLIWGERLLTATLITLGLTAFIYVVFIEVLNVLLPSW